MTSMAAESVTTIQVSSQQTRFDIKVPDYRELDVRDLDINIVCTERGTSRKGKNKASVGDVKILSSANLKLEAGQRYALLGRNGSGKSTLLKAISQKLIPDIPEETRITSLQQTDAREVSGGGPLSVRDVPKTDRTVLEEVIERVTSKDTIKHEIAELLAAGADNVANGTVENRAHALQIVRAYRKITHERRQKQLFLLDKQARLRSGTRGLQARKALRQFEKVIAESQEWVGQRDEDIVAGDAMHREIEEALDMLADLQLLVEPTAIADVENCALKTLEGLGFTKSDMQRRMSTLSGGWMMRTALASTLLDGDNTDILILDEPTNYLDLRGIMWLQNHLTRGLDELDSAHRPTLILVSHDRDFITNTTTDLIIIQKQQLVYFHGSLAAYETGRAEKRLYMTRMKEAQDKQKARIQDTIVKSRQQGKKSQDDNKLRQAKSMQKRLDERWGLHTNAKGGTFKLNRDLQGYHLTMRAEVVVDKDERPVSFTLKNPPSLTRDAVLIHLSDAEFRYEPPAGSANKKTGVVNSSVGPTLKKTNLTVSWGDRIGILGLNGVGKSTMIRLLVGQTQPTSGSVTLHSKLRLGYYSQGAVDLLLSLAAKEPELTALSLLSRDVDEAKKRGAEAELDNQEIRGVLGDLGLPGHLASDVPLAQLSGGQLVRCALARVLWKVPHVLVLDEVTTHLDYETVGAMRSALRMWEGAVVLVSHDRWFMRGVVEGEWDDEEDDESHDRFTSSDEALTRKRVVYQLSKGKLQELKNGVTGFEHLMERELGLNPGSSAG